MIAIAFKHSAGIRDANRYRQPIAFQLGIIRWSLILIFGILSGCTSLPENKHRTASYTVPDTSETTLAKAVLKQRKINSASVSDSGMHLLKNGLDAFVARAALARVAERSLDVQYYLFHSDLSGSLLFYELWKAAERGVRVRVLLDDMDLDGKDRILAILNSHPNLEIRVFNPFIRGKFRATQYVFQFGSVTRRMHNKAFIADNHFAILGGRNIGDEYFDAAPNLAFGDLDVSLIGAAVNQTSNAFDLYWNSRLSYPVEKLSNEVSVESLQTIRKNFKTYIENNGSSDYSKALDESDLVELIRRDAINYHWGHAKIIYDHPEKILAERKERTKFNLMPQLRPYTDAIKEELIVVSPYFIPGNNGVAFFKSLVEKGIKIRVLTNSLASNDVPIVHSGYSKYRKQLLESGVELYELDITTLGPNFKNKPSRKNRLGHSVAKVSLHAKYFVIDREQAFIGSLNLDPRSTIENTEIGTIIESPSLARELATEFDSQIASVAFKVELVDDNLIWQSHRRDKMEVFTTEPYTSAWDRMCNWLMTWLPVESQL